MFDDHAPFEAGARQARRCAGGAARFLAERARSQTQITFFSVEGTNGYTQARIREKPSLVSTLGRVPLDERC